MIDFDEALEIGGNMLLDQEWLRTSAIYITYDDEAWYFTNIEGARGTEDFVIKNNRTIRVMKDTGEADWFDPYNIFRYYKEGYKERLKHFTLIE